MLNSPKTGSPTSPNVLRVVVDPFDRFQTIFGFGGAFSDAVGINLNALSGPVRAQLLRAYFHPEKGIGYTIGRVPIASTDFSTREYSYADSDNDFEMDTFALAPEDLEAKIPYIKSALGLSDGRLKLIACPWSAPAWMKSNGRMSGDGELKGPVDGPYYRAYAKYLRKFFDAYAEKGLNFLALTIQNQPQRVEPDFPFQAMFMSNRTQREFAERILRPLLNLSPHTSKLKLLAFDDVRQFFLPSLQEIFGPQSPAEHNKSKLCQIVHYLLAPFIPFLSDILKAHVDELIGCDKSPDNNNNSGVIDGFGTHWYTLDGHSDQSVFHKQFPDKMILSTEACTGFVQTDDAGPRLGNWTRGWQYGWDIVQNLRHWTNGWVDWNICLDMGGGPNWAHNMVDAPIIVNPARDEFYKQPMFYFLAHFSHFISPGSVRIGSYLQQGSGEPIRDDPGHPVQHIAALTPQGQRVLVLIHSGSKVIRVRLEEADEVGSRGAEIEMGPDSILTAILP